MDVRHYEAIPASQPAFHSNISVSGGPAPVRAFIEAFLLDILQDRSNPGASSTQSSVSLRIPTVIER